MKKLMYFILAAILVLSFASATFAENNGWIQVKPKLVGANQLQSMSKGGNGGSSAIIGREKITPPSVWFSYWGQTGAYVVRFYGSNIEPNYIVRVYIDSRNKGHITPQRTFVQNSDSSSGLINLKEMTGQTEIYEPGIHHIEVRVYITNKIYYSYGLYNLDVPYFDAGISSISSDGQNVTVRYYLQPIFVSLTAGDPVNITVNDNFNFSSIVQTDQWGYYFAGVSMTLAEYQNSLQNQYLTTTVEIQGYSRAFNAYYWTPYPY